MQPGQQPVLVLSEDTKRERGKDAQKKNIEAAKAIAGVVQDYTRSKRYGQDARR